MADGVREVAELPDPVGRVLSGSTLGCGLEMEKITVPLGVIGIIFEARPNVTSDAAALCLKSGNACVLRGGKEAIRSNTAIARVMRAALRAADMDENCVCLIEDTARETATAMMRLNGYIDCLIPRGGAGLIRSVVENATVPVIETGVGNCHAYVEKSADIAMAAEIVFNAKTSRPSVCNAPGNASGGRGHCRNGVARHRRPAGGKGRRTARLCAHLQNPAAGRARQ